MSVYQQTRTAFSHLAGRCRLPASQLVALLALGVSFAWAYWTTVSVMAERWAHEPQYSHGYLVPVFAAFLFWSRRALCPAVCRPDPWGLAVLAAGAGLRLGGIYFHLTWLDAVSLIVCVGGVVLLFGGRPALRWSWPALAFLLFMLPLPFRVEGALAHPLQRLATQASTFLLVVLGFPATAQGNVITISESQVSVVAACGGLSMLLTFFALAVACALLIRRPLGDRVAIVASAIPVALFANVVRITVTAILYETVGGNAARTFFHDVAGWFMMLLAVGVLWLELKVLARLFRDPEASCPVPFLAP